MAKTHQYDNAAQQRVLRLLLVLAGHELHGLSLTECAKAMGASASMTTRDLHNLREAGFAEQVEETSRWRLAAKPVQIAIKFQAALARAETRLDDTRNRFTRTL